VLRRWVLSTEFNLSRAVTRVDVCSVRRAEREGDFDTSSAAVTNHHPGRYGFVLAVVDLALPHRHALLLPRLRRLLLRWSGGVPPLDGMVILRRALLSGDLSILWTDDLPSCCPRRRDYGFAVLVAGAAECFGRCVNRGRFGIEDKSNMAEG
jgi:hypothetical protein